MTITRRPRWSLGRGKPPVPSGWQATGRKPRAVSFFRCPRQDSNLNCARPSQPGDDVIYDADLH